MSNSLLLSPIKKSAEYHQLIGSLKSRRTPVAINGITDSQKPHIAYGLFENLGQQIFIITYNQGEARRIYEDLQFYIKDKAYYFPAKELTFYEADGGVANILENRLKVLEKLSSAEEGIFVASIEALQQKIITPKDFSKHKISFQLGESISIASITKTLFVQGYKRVDMVEEGGEYSIRGGIIDVFPYSSQYPYRIELFDDEVDSIRRFDPETQKSMDKINQITVFSATEMLVEEEDAVKIADIIAKELNKTKDKLMGESRERLIEKHEEIIEKIKNQMAFKGRELFIPYIENKTASLIDYISNKAIVMIDEPRRQRETAEAVMEGFRDDFKTLMERGEVLPTQGKLIYSYDEILPKITKFSSVTLNILPKYNADYQPKEVINITSRSIQNYSGKIEFLVEDLKKLQYKGYKIALLPGTEERALRLFQLLTDRGIKVRVPETPQADLQTGEVVILKGSIYKGFEYVLSKFVIITDEEIYGVHKKKKQPSKRKDASPIKSFIDLQVGDFVVHEGHGIGKYIGIQELTVDGIKKDYFKIRYSGEDNLYVPTDQMDLIQKYIGSDESPPKLNKLGGGEWSRTKAKVKKAIEDMAQDLLKLYAEREKSVGYTFGKDTDWQKQFEDLFPYEETPDQLKCINEVKNDMEKSRPMDRLLCGDVGYGKTEVAIRASFKAAIDGKQVAFLVPTTILAQQHYNTFAQRFSGFPIKVEVLSRFKNPSQQKQILEEARTGNVDILIGTHRILSKDIAFKDLGLLIIDEEQRFGVKHKETLKQLKKNIDVLTLTATPIPRTLHMAMVGIRDMSVIEDPPEERFPVHTYVMAHNDAVIKDAIHRELARDGQVYYVYNRVQGIHQIAARLREMIPQARIGVGHGQMSERQLENLMIEYYQGVYDVLVCTTIIETGLDIPNVNTIIIHNADALGLSQLYQLRGRVGRSTRQAYAYLLYEKDKALSEVAEKRLKAIKEFTEFGSGFKIAMRDLEIRGAGNLLGGQQHGHMAAIGYDLYVKLLEETIGEYKGEAVEKLEDTTIELNVNAYISDKYIVNQNQKISIYKKIASIRNKKDLYAIEEEIEDRYGDIPSSVRNLLLISYVKALGKNIRVSSIQHKNNEILITFKDSSLLMPENIGLALHTYGRSLTFHSTKEPYFNYKVTNNDQNKILEDLKDIIEKISGLQKNIF